jgi:hypothetical protein
MSQKIVEHSLKLLNDLVAQSKELSDRAERKVIKFGDKEKIISLCETYIQKRGSSLWLKNLELEKIFLQNIL